MANSANMGGNIEVNPNNSVKSKKDDIKAVQKRMAEASKLERKYREQGNKEEAEAQKRLLEEEKEEKKKLEQELKNIKLKNQAEINKKNKEELIKASNEAGQKLASSLVSGLGTLKSTLDDTMNDFIEKQESMAYGLTGTSKNLTDVTTTFTKALGSTGVVKQEAVYNKLSDLIQSGIIFNAEQRAYLGTIAEDLGMIFDPTEGSLTRLINLQRQDLSDERMAIEYSLKEFLNQNYQTSQYIKEGFADVSSALVEAQSIMSADSAMQLEAAVQQWLGSMSSVGASADVVNKLATAIGQLGSGDLSVLSSDQFPLLAMAASNAGLSIGQLLNEGLTGNSASSLLAGIASYAGSLYGSAGSNIVKSELGKAFGISNISDLVALSQVGDVSSGGSLSTDISLLLNNMDNYLYKTTKINNSLANFMYEWGTSVAANETNYMIYKVTDVLSQAAASMFSGVNITAGFLGNGVELNLSSLISAVPLLTTLPGLINSIGSLGSTLGAAGSAANIYEALASGKLAGTNQTINISGLLSGAAKSSGTNTSGAMTYFNSDSADIGSTAKTSGNAAAASVYSADEEVYDINDVYELLETFKTTSFGTYAKIVESDNKVSLGEDLSLAEDMLKFSAYNIQNIYALLLEHFTGSTSQYTYDLDKLTWNTEEVPFGWTGTANS